jgi:DNA repair protein RecN (Recombination protein N)
MLKHLEIENYILIDHLEIDFYEGFSAITGETGAGKSIILGAIELILGNRADTQVLLDKEMKCSIEGTFQVAGYGLEPFFEQYELDYDRHLILRREISPTGKSRAFINDTPVNLLQMRELGVRLVDIHSQNSTMTLNQADFQLAVLDSFAGTITLAGDYAEKYLEYKANGKKLALLAEEEAKARTEEDYLRFQFDELESANLKEDEQQELEESVNILSHAEEIKENLFLASQLLASGEVNILSLLTEAQTHLRKISAFHPEVAVMLERLVSGSIELKDLSAEISRAEETTEFDPAELIKLQERLDLIFRLQSKHHVASIPALIGIRERLQGQLANITSLDRQISDLKQVIEAQRDRLIGIAAELSARRSGSIAAFEQEIQGLLQHMGMPQATFRIMNSQAGDLTKDGTDKLAFLFNANKGHELKPLSDIASGGELSRVMLGIKAMITQKNLLPTIIFDEIDNGISGDIAGRVGDVLVRTAGSMQVLAITHLPQIAGKAAVQYNVYKNLSGSTTVSGIRMLSAEERVDELAKMISGNEITVSSRQTARELLNKISIFDN